VRLLLDTHVIGLPRQTDPFDRMLVAQAQTEGVTFVTHDRQLQPYDVPIVWV
jgi:PIN domain nuclease of toxin-antitoxin system